MAKKLKPVHPGEILGEDFMKPHNLSMNKLALNLRVPVTRIADIVAERRGITPDTALRLGRYFKTTPQFWLNLQTKYDLEIAEDERLAEIERDVHPLETVARWAKAGVGLLNRVGVVGVARIDWLASREAFVLAMVEADAVFAELPAKINFLVVEARREIEQSDVDILYYAAGGGDAFERGLNAGFEAIAFETRSRRLLVGNLKAAGALDALL